MKLCHIALIAMFVFPARPAEAQPSAVSPSTFILAGQSNMSGRGDLETLTVQERVPDPHIRLFGNDGRWRDAIDPLDDAHGQIDDVSTDRLAAVGPGLFFARELTATLGKSVALIPCAKGGSSIRGWKPDSSVNTLYGSCLSRAKVSGNAITGILWYQGETDAQNGKDARRWSGRFKRMIKEFRRDLKAPHLPVVLVELADRPTTPDHEPRFPAWTTIQRKQRLVQLPCTKIVSARSLSRNKDDLHLTTDAQRHLGPALAKAMAALLKDRCG